ncbi:hypothetical protein SAMN05216229_10685 [Geopseudomonas sagittaria]|uniref:DUF2064 domain-containing protein n=1 Tax=Geopseudomonas sagittaria TaxID=1135990 RepID=A0A1I5TFD9_9GAMM|nr:DUF2064 domain-containing protein [Pseudomonas sagittaria]SFP81764.1 hypothetical protein SAMN05216229_10685 [Pseudomonas sagittaria]
MPQRSAIPPTLVLVCKRPALGHGKQRLAVSLGTQQAWRIAERLLDCALEDLVHWPGATVIAPDRTEHRDWAGARAPLSRCLAQTPGNLGERLNALDRTLRAAGQRSLVFIGSDAPALGEDDYRQVREALAEVDTVLLAARDGGVVLMASNRPWPDLAALPWSTPALGQALAAACRAAGHSLRVCGESFDIDEPADLQHALRALAEDPRPARRRLLHTLAASSAERA